MQVSNDTFDCLERYTPQKAIGRGAYGIVCSAVDKVTGELVAIKKISETFRHNLDARRTLTEVKLLKHFSKHDNIIGIRDIFPPPEMPNFKDIYLVYDVRKSDFVCIGMFFYENEITLRCLKCS